MRARLPDFAIGLNAVIVAVSAEHPRILTVRRNHEASAETMPPTQRSPGEEEALPFGPLDPAADRTLELTLRRWVRQQTGLELGYVEQLYTFADRHRDPLESGGGPRGISISYLALVREVHTAAAAHWRDWYEFLPWEDRREGSPGVVERGIVPALERWIGSGEGEAERLARRERVDIAFGLGASNWNGERVLDRFELLYEAGAVVEARRDHENRGGGEVAAAGVLDPRRETALGRPLIMDHRRILATGLGRLRGKVRYRPVVFELLPERFTLLELQQTVQALAGVVLHKGNFRRLVDRTGLVEGTGAFDRSTGGRPAELYRFRREVLRERRAPGVGLPGTPA